MSVPESFAATLYRILPALYRTRDETGDLRAYLQGCGELLDAIYATLRQRHADNFPDNPPPGATMAPAQDWLLPYFADLVDATLVSPLPDGRRNELANAIRWRQGKGTLATIDRIVEAIGLTQSVVQEGLQRVAVTPRIAQPLRPAVSFGYAQEPLATCPGNMARHPDLPAATVDLRCPSRAIAVPVDQPQPGTQTITIDGETRIWRQGSYRGLPCFPGSHEDVSRRTADMRTPDWRVGHAHPRRILAYLSPPSGFFPPNAPVVAWAATPSAAYLDLVDVDDTAPGLVVHRNRTLGTDAFIPVVIGGAVNLDLAPPATHWRFEGLSFRQAVTSTTARVVMERCAVRRAAVDTSDLAEPVLKMTDCLANQVNVSNGLARLVGVTVLRETRVAAVQASDCLFVRRVSAPASVSQAPPSGGCIRFSGITANQPKGSLHYWQNTTEIPAFVTETYAARHVGVLSPANHKEILTGAEDEGECGAGHHARHAAVRAAILTKLRDFLPVGQELVLIPDARLTEPAWAAP